MDEQQEQQERIQLHNLSPTPGSTKARKRVGRGQGSGTGKTSGRGQKGQKSRSGSHMMRAGFIGGQMPLHMQVPKLRGAHSKDSMPIGPFRTYTHGVNVAPLAARFEAGAEVTPEALLAARVLRTLKHPVKILGDGELEVALTIHAHGFSASARKKIEAAGGTVVFIGGEELPVEPVRDPVKRAAAEARAAAAPAKRKKALPPTMTTTRTSPSPTADEPSRDEPAADETARGRRGLMFGPLMNIWRVPDLRRRLGFTFLIIALYRVGSWLPTPGVNTSSLRTFFGDGANGTILSVLNIFAGGALANLSLFALGIMPYITASIILQLMQTVVPSLEKLSKEGESGYKKITQYTRYLTVVLAAFQSAGYVFLFHNGSAIGANDLLPDLTVGRFILIVTTLTAGTTLLMWMGELITQRGVGNGISLLIFASILTSAPPAIDAWLNGGTFERLALPDRDARA